MDAEHLQIISSHALRKTIIQIVNVTLKMQYQ